MHWCRFLFDGESLHILWRGYQTRINCTGFDTHIVIGELRNQTYRSRLTFNQKAKTRKAKFESMLWWQRTMRKSELAALRGGFRKLDSNLKVSQALMCFINFS